MLPVLSVEFRKLNRSLALLLAVVAPTLIAAFCFANALRIGEAGTWSMWIGSGLMIWAFFMLPMSVTALTALVAQMEHAPRSWDHLRALPLPRWRLYAAKAVVVLTVIAAMTALTLALTIGALTLVGAARPEMAPTGPLDLAAQALMAGKMLLAALLMIAIQLWTALRFSSFVPGLALGIGGTFFAVVATASKAGVFLPWQMAVNMGAEQQWRADTALALGFGGGVIALVLAVAHLSQREAR
jgi:hypothetical protein